MFDIHRVELDWGGRKLVLESGRIARPADGAALATYGETTVLATVVSATAPREGIDFLPLTCNHQDKCYAAARTLSGAPVMGPVGAARVGFINNEYVLNPQLDEMSESQLDLVVAGTGDAVLMVESEAKELPEEVMLGAVMFGHKHFQPVIDAIISLAEKAAKEPRDFALAQSEAVEKEMLGLVEKDLRAAYGIPGKQE